MCRGDRVLVRVRRLGVGLVDERDETDADSGGDDRDHQRDADAAVEQVQQCEADERAEHGAAGVE